MTNQNIKFYLLSSAALVLLSALSCFIGGVFQVVAGIFIAALLGVQTTKYHYGYVFSSALLLFATPLLIVGFFSDAAFSTLLISDLLLTVPLILMGFTLGFAANTKLSFYKTCVLLTIIYLAGTLTQMKMLSNSSAVFSLENIIADSVEQFQTALDSVYGNTPETTDFIGSLLGEIGKMMLTLSPAVFTLLSLLIAFLCAMIFKSLAGKRQIDMSYWPPFYKLRADKLTSLLFLLVFVLNTCAPEGLFADLCFNVIVILSGIFLLYGLSFLDWTLRCRGMKRLPRRLLLIACIPLCTSFFMLLPIPIALGLLDGLLDFRAKKPQKRL